MRDGLSTKIQCHQHTETADFIGARSRRVASRRALAGRSDASPRADGAPGVAPDAAASHRRRSAEAAVQHTNLMTLRRTRAANAPNQYVATRRPTSCAELKCVNRKLLRRKYAGQGRDEAPGAVRKEIAIMKKLSHPNVVRLREVIDDESGQYIFMALEYVPGGPLYDPARYDGKGMGRGPARKYFWEHALRSPICTRLGSSTAT